MSLLYLRARPVVAFDANNADHRRYYRQFLETRSWGYCPVRFMVESLNTDLLTHINREMLTWYVKQEFKYEKGKAKTKIATKPKSPGTRGTIRRKQSVQTKAD